MAIIKQLTNKLLGLIYPVTVTQAIYDNNGNKLSDTIIMTDDNTEQTDDVSINADLFKGHGIDEFVLKGGSDDSQFSKEPMGIVAVLTNEYTVQGIYSSTSFFKPLNKEVRIIAVQIPSLNTTTDYTSSFQVNNFGNYFYIFTANSTFAGKMILVQIQYV